MNMKKLFTNFLVCTLKNKKFIANILIIFFLIIANAVETYSQQYHIQGNISTDSAVISYVYLTFIEQGDTSKKYSTITDANGNYQINIITEIKEDNPVIPKNIELGQNYPNPFSVETVVPYKLNNQADIIINIYNILGEKVKTFKLGLQINGIHAVIWDGRNNFGNKVAPGIYLYQLLTKDEMLVNKMVYTGGGRTLIPFFKSNKFLSEGGINLSKKFVKKERVTKQPQEYTVYIENIDNTQPKILAYEFKNIAIQNDTVINFQVKKAEWKSLGLENETVTAIAVDPVSSNIIYAGTMSDFSAGMNGKLFKSNDYGETWDTLLIGGSYRDIIIDPANNNVIYALPGSIIKSEDSGQTWETIINGINIDSETRLQCLAMNPKNPNILYAGTAGFFLGALYKSYDGGLHWNEIGNDSLLDGVINLAIGPIDTNNIYAGTSGRGILWKSTDAGNTWFRTGLDEKGAHDILVDPLQPLNVYAGLRGIFKTENGGISWKEFDNGLPEGIIDVVKIQNYNSQLFIVVTFGDDGGIYKYSDLQNKWVEIGIDNLHVSYYYSDLEISTNSNKLFFGGKGIYVMELK